jgi:O-antigen/teichoic acid export membrane protein
MSLKRKVAQNTIIQIIGKSITTLLGIFALVLMTRYLGPEGFGQYTTITSFLMFFGILVDFGLTLVTARMLAEPGIDTNKTLSNLFTIRFFSALIFLGLAPITVFFFPYPSIIKIGVALATFSFFLSSLSQILIGLFQKNLAMAKVVMAELFSRLTLLILIIIAIWQNLGLLAIILAVVLATIVNFAANFFFSFKYAKICFAFDFTLWQKIFRKAWPLAFGITFNLIYFKADTIILSLYRSQIEVGLYGAPYRVLEVVLTIPTMFMGIILPILTNLWLSKKTFDFEKVIKMSFDFLMILAVPLVIGTLFLAKPLMILVAGVDFTASGAILKILILASGLIFAGTFFGHIIVAIEKQKQMLWAYFLTALLGLIGYLIFIPRYSYFGAAWVTVFAEGLIALCGFWLVWRTTKIKLSLNVLSRALAASLVMAGFILLFRNYDFFFLLIGSFIIYFISLYLLRGFSKEMVLEIIKIK